MKLEDDSLSFDFSRLSDKERRQYYNLEALFTYSFGESKDEETICHGLIETTDDWKKKMGGRSSLQPYVAGYLDRIRRQDRDAARNLYFFISPIFFYIHVLYELSRREWRNATSWSGMFCERTAKNLLLDFDRKYSTNIWQKIRKSRFENKIGKLKSELEAKNFKLASELFNLMQIIYSLRDTRGPHDVPPPEPIRAQISASQCLPVYIDYLETLIFLENNIREDHRNFVSFFSNLTETKVSLTFEKERGRVTVDHVLRNILYRNGFFGRGRKLGDIQEELKKMGYNFSASTVAGALYRLSKGKEAVLTRKGKRTSYTYYERYPPQEIFKTII